MPTFAAASSLPPVLLLSRQQRLVSRPSLPRRLLLLSPLSIGSSRSRAAVLVAASSAASFDELYAKGRPHHRLSQKSVLSNLIQEIDPLDVSLIQKDVPADTVDAMKRTISGMLGLLPSDQFHVLVEAFWEPLFKLLVSSMMTGYTLRNAEYRLCLERNLDINEEHFEKRKVEILEQDNQEIIPEGASFGFPRTNELLANPGPREELLHDNMGIDVLGKMTPEAQEYILLLRSRLSSVKKELHDIKGKNYALQMQQFVGEEKNDLLDYLRSLKPEKVAELSEPTCPSIQQTIHTVVHGLLATLSPRMHSKAAPQSENGASETLNIGKDDSRELVEDTSLHFQPLISVYRDYLARLLFWCMLLGHYLRGLEYRLELMQLLTISGDVGCVPQEGDTVA